jgi:hypothetical protein
MATVYQIAGDEVREELNYVMEKYHQPLFDAGVSIDLLKAFSGSEEDPVPLRHHGYAALALVRICSLKDRVKGCSDAEIVLDGVKCDEWSTDELRAILDHELTHLDLCYDKKTGKLVRDDISRPKLKIRLHDRQFGWFGLMEAQLVGFPLARGL